MKPTERTGLLDRTLRNIRGAWNEIAETAAGVFAPAAGPSLEDDSAEHLRVQMRACLESRGGEVSARARAAGRCRRAPSSRSS